MSQLPPKQRRTTQPPPPPQRPSPPQRSAPERQGDQRQTAQSASSQRAAPRRTSTVQRRPVAGQRSRYSQPPPRDPFPIVIGAIVFAGLVSVVLIVLLLGSNNTSNPATVPATIASGVVATNAPPNTVGGVMTQPSPGGATATTNTSSDLPGTPIPSEGNKHVQASEPITYTTYPPSSGTHYDATAPYGFSAVEIPEGQIVHSMEHGAIVLYYKPDVAQSVKDELKKAYNQLPAAKYGKVKMVIAPYSQGMQTPLALAAWTRLLPMAEYNYQTVFTFYKALVDKGPEDVP